MFARHWCLTLLLISICHVAVADVFYVPVLPGDSTEIRVTNNSRRDLAADVSLLGAPDVTRILLRAGETARWPAPSVDRLHAAVVSADGMITVASWRRHGEALTTARAARTAMSEASVTRQSGDWRSGIIVINPDDIDASISVDGESVDLPAHAVRVIDAASFVASRPVIAYTYERNIASGAQVIAPAQSSGNPNRRRAVAKGVPDVPVPVPVKQTIVITPSKDNTLFETSNGSLSNGAGVHLFSGLTNRGELRRALVRFDVAGQIPSGAKINSASLTMSVSMSVTGNQAAAIHAVTADWGEGTSNAGDSQDGDGGTSRTNDATWIHTFFPNQMWRSKGGDFNATSDATAQAGSFGPVTWTTSAAMVTRVQGWLDNPSTNFGWIIITAERSARSAKRFDSREARSADTRPALTIEFTK